MPNITLRGIPDDVHADLKAAAKRNHRSLNGEILARLSRSVRPLPADRAELLQRIEERRREIGPVDLDPETTLERIQRRYDEIGPIHLDDETIRELRSQGRP